MSEENELQTTQAQTNYGIAPDHFEKVIANLPEDQADVLRWWYFHGKDRRLSLSKLATVAGTSTTTLSRVFRGKYEAELGSLCAKLAKARSTVGESADNPDFIMTALAKRFFRIADRVRALGTVAILWGAMGIGKTTIGDEYVRQNNHGRTILVRCGSRMTFSQFVNHMAIEMGIITKNRGQREVRYKIQSLLKAGQRLLIIDELHQIFLTCKPDTAVQICEFLRECYDISGCGMLLVGTEVLEKEFFHGPHKAALAQLVDRGTIQIPLPAKPTKQDVIAFLAHYRLPFPGDDHPEACFILTDIIASSGLRKLTLHLRDGAATAGKLKQTYTWDHFVQAHDDIAGLSKAS
jgi:DNA transposition AAA+ family ATPase